jgi:hypothetical protein
VGFYFLYEFCRNISHSKHSPIAICATRQIPNNDPKFQHPLIVDGVGRSTRASFAILNRGCLFHVGLFIILCDARAPLIH